MKKLKVSDITLVVAQEERKSISFREKLQIAASLAKMGVDGIELPAACENKETAVVYRTLAESVPVAVCMPVGDSEASLNFAYSCIKGAKKPVLQVVLPVSTVQMEYAYHLKAAKMLEKIAALTAAAKALCSSVEFIAKDATRAEAGFAAAACKTAVENGATSVCLCDDNGAAFPAEFAALVKEVKGAVSVPVFMQPSNKLAMAAACAVEGIKAGADGVKTALSGGLRSEVFADIVRERGDALGVSCGIDVTAAMQTVATIGGANKEADASIEPSKKEIKFDEATGLSEIMAQIALLGYELSEEDSGKVYEECKRLAEQKGILGAAEIEAVIASTAMQVPSTYHVISYVVNSGNVITATATVTLERDGEKLMGVSTGDGPIDAAFHAIEQIVGHHYELDDFQIQAITKGREALGSSLIRLRAGGKVYPGSGVSTDIIGACVRAYINALNKIVYGE